MRSINSRSQHPSMPFSIDAGIARKRLRKHIGMPWNAAAMVRLGSELTLTNSRDGPALDLGARRALEGKSETIIPTPLSADLGIRSRFGQPASISRSTTVKSAKRNSTSIPMGLPCPTWSPILKLWA